MVSVNLKEPILSLALEPVARIKQNDEVAVGELWSVLSKVKTAVADGRRLENLTWRLWYQARRSLSTQGSLRTYSQASPLVEAPPPPLRPPILSCPSLTLSCSSEETNTSSDWEQETAITGYDQLQNAEGELQKAAVSPPSKFARTLSLASSGVVPFHQEINTAAENDGTRRLPPTLTKSHDWPFQSTTEMRKETVSSQEAAVPYSEAHNQSTGTRAVSLLPHLPETPKTGTPNESKQRVFSSLLITQTAPPPSGQCVHDNHHLLTSKVASSSSSSSSAPAKPRTEQDCSSVGNLVISVLSAKTMPQDRRSVVRTQGPPVATAQGRIAADLPEIVEHQLPMLRPPYVWPTPSSALTSATSTPRQAFPTVIVVNPTPHPTPPTTPSHDLPEHLSDLMTTSTSSPINRPERPTNLDEGGSVINGQLATPVSVNGDTKLDNPLVVADSVNNHVDQVETEVRSGQIMAQPIIDHVSVPEPASTTALLERSINCDVSSHCPPPAAELLGAQTEMSHTAAISSPAPIPAPHPSEEKKFYLAAPRSGSGGSSHSTESLDSTRMGSLSPMRRGVHGASALSRDCTRRREEHRPEEEAASSFSTGSPAGRPPSVASSRDGVARKSPAFMVAGVSRRKQGAKKAALLGRDSRHKRDHSLTDHFSDREKTIGRSRDKSKEKGKQKEADPTQTALISNMGYGTKALQRVPSHRSNLADLAPHQLRQLPTNPPPPRQTSPPRREPPPQHQTAAVPQNTRQLPLFPQLGHLPLGHLPTVPPKQRRPIEITSSDYSTSDSDEDGSSWESESASVEEARNEKPSGSKDNALGPSRAKKPDATSRSNGGRDPGELARDAALEAQRQRELFKKLPPRSYSNLGQLPRTKSGLSILFKPDPETLPEGHPYRTSRSSQDLFQRNRSAPAPPFAMTSIVKRAGVAAPVQDTVTVASVGSKGDLAGMAKGRMLNGSPRNAYRPRGRPADQAEETESGDDDPEDIIQISSSVAEKRLAALAGARTRPRPPPPPPSQAPVDPPPPITRTATLPVEMMRQYLVEPAPLQTPHTIRKNIISQELNEDLRRHLLAERSSNNQIQGRPARAQGSILPGPWKPMTPMRPPSEEQQRTPAEDPKNRSFATQRTKSWAGDYHAHGW